MLCSEHVYVRVVSILGALENVPEHSEESINITKLIYQQRTEFPAIFKTSFKNNKQLLKPATSVKQNLFVYHVSFYGP